MTCEYHRGYLFGMRSLTLGVIILGLLNFLMFERNFHPEIVIPIVVVMVMMEMFFYFKINFFGCEYCGEANETL